MERVRLRGPGNFRASAWTVELKNRHIRSNVLSPGPIDTPIIGQLPADALARIVSTIPMGRMGDADEVAKARRLFSGLG